MATPIRLKRSSVTGKRPILDDLQLGELALNFYDGYLWAKRDTAGVGIGTTIALLTPWTENFGAGSIYYNNLVGIGTDTPLSTLDIYGTLNITGVSTFLNRVIFNSTNSIQIPVGTTAQRDPIGVAVTGQIRYNSQYSTFEGYGPGGQWGSLGGVKDVDGNTYIIPESSPGANENILYFYNDGTLTATINPATASFYKNFAVTSGVSTFSNTVYVYPPAGNFIFKAATSSLFPVVIDQYGDVGIGVSNPSEVLHVNSGNYTRPIFEGNSGASLYLRQPPSDLTGSNVELYNSYGTVGLSHYVNGSGPTTYIIEYENSTKSTKFQVNGNNLLKFYGADGNGYRAAVFGDNSLYSGLTLTGTYDQPLQVKGSAYIGGNLGIGSTNPSVKLAVQGDVRVSGVITASTFNGQVNSGIATFTQANITTANISGANIVAGVVTTISGTNLNYSGVGTIGQANITTANISGANIVSGIVTTINGTNLNYSGVGTITQANISVGNISTARIVAGIITTISGTNLNYSGVGTIGQANITTANVSTANIVVGVVTTISGTNLSYTGVATISQANITTDNITTANIVTGIVTTISGTNLNYSGVGTITQANISVGNISTARIVSGIVTTISGTNLNYSGVSTIGQANITTANISGANIVAGIVTTISGTNLSYTGVGTISQANITQANIATANIVSGIVTTISGTNLSYSGIGTITTRLDVGTGVTISSGVVTATTRLSTGNTGVGINITTNTISGPAELVIDPAAVGDNTGAVRIKGDLLVDGTQTFINSTAIELADFNVGIATTVGTNLLLDGAGIGIGSTNIRKTITWNNTASALTSSEDWNLITGKQYEINGTSVLNATTLGTGVVNSSLTSLGTLTGLNVSGVSTFNNTGFFAANRVLHFGSTTSGTLQIYSDATTSYITENTSALRIYSNNLNLQDYTSSKNYLTAAAGAGPILYYNNIETLKTLGYGVTVTGNLSASGISSAVSYDTISSRTGSTTATTSSIAQVGIHSLSATTYRSVEYIIQANQSTNYHIVKILAIHDGSIVYLTEYGSQYNTSAVATYDVDISGGNIRLLATPASASSTTFKVHFTSIVV